MVPNDGRRFNEHKGTDDTVKQVLMESGLPWPSDMTTSRQHHHEAGLQLTMETWARVWKDCTAPGLLVMRRRQSEEGRIDPLREQIAERSGICYGASEHIVMAVFIDQCLLQVAPMLAM